jgi:hypothetical protein
MFVLATLSATTVTGPIKIRNMSSTGALIEGAPLPQMGEQVRLRKGQLSACGTVVWLDAGRAGVRFDNRVEVAAWLPAQSGKHQAADQGSHQVNADWSRDSVSRVPNVKPPPLDRNDLLGLAEALDGLANDLAGDPRAVARYTTSLQTLEVASKTLRKLAAS